MGPLHRHLPRRRRHHLRRSYRRPPHRHHLFHFRLRHLHCPHHFLLRLLQQRLLHVAYDAQQAVPSFPKTFVHHF